MTLMHPLVHLECQVAGWSSGHCNRGVRQEDPLFPLIFATKINEAAESGGGISGCVLEKSWIFFNSRSELERRVLVFRDRLSLNPAKSRPVMTVKSGYSVVLSPSPLKISEELIPCLSPDAVVKCPLGLVLSLKQEM